ncbi:hypothetical protein LXL04_020572 [Taraxacum kok-saghyz]
MNGATVDMNNSQLILHNALIATMDTELRLARLINTHVHTSQQLARGIADDVDLLTWLHHRIWPYESNMTEEDSYISTLLCGIELIHSGIGYLCRCGVKVSHCPAAAMRMLGFAPIREMLDANICVSLGTDGAPSNNRMSIVDEMYVASLINKGREVYANGTTNPTALPAQSILNMATLNGAKALLWDNDIGSFQVGKKADMIVINPSSWSMVPIHDCISSLVYCLRTENIVSVMCNGRWIMKNQKIMNVDEVEIISMAKRASAQLLKRAGIQLPQRMNFV